MIFKGVVTDIINVILGALIIILTLYAILDNNSPSFIYPCVFAFGFLLSVCNAIKTAHKNRIFFVLFLFGAVVFLGICIMLIKHLSLYK